MSRARAVFLCGFWLVLTGRIFLFPDAHAEENCWRVISGQMPPFSYEVKGHATGFMVDLFGAAARRGGAALKVEYYPWARAVALAQAGPETLIFPLARTPDREGLFSWVLPLYTQKYIVVAPRRAKLSADAAIPSNARVGLIRGTTLKKDIPALAGKTVVEGRDYLGLFRMLDENMIDVIVGPASIVQASMKLIDRDPGAYRIGATVGHFELWLAASLDLRSERTAVLEEAIRAMRRDGSYDRLLKRYDLDEDAGGDSQLRSGGGSRLSSRSSGFLPSPSAATASPE